MAHFSIGGDETRWNRSVRIDQCVLTSNLILIKVTYVARALSQYEHDEIIEKALKKSRVESIPVKITLDIGAMTKFGWLIMPDVDGGQGPLYIAKLRVTE